MDAPLSLSAQRFRNTTRSFFQLLAISALFGLTAWMLGGTTLLWIALAGVAFLFVSTPRLPSWVLLRMQRARPIEG